MRILLSLLASTVPVLAIWPVPSSYTHGNTTLWIDENVKVLCTGAQHVS